MKPIQTKDTSDNNINNKPIEFKNDTYFKNLANNINTLWFIKDLKKEEDSLREYANHIHYGIIEKYLVSKL